MTDDETVTQAIADNRPTARRPYVLGVAAVALIALSFALAGYGLRSASEDESDALGVARRVASKAQALERQVRSLGEKPVVDVPAPDQLPDQVAGPAGIQGLTGLPGQPGERGARGPRGRTGRPGRPGAAGPPGRTVVGPQGKQGLPGVPGESITGPQGEVGPQGPGPGCEPNCQGAPGPAGPAGPQGAPGQSAFPFTFTFQPSPGQSTTCTINAPTDFTCDTQPTGGA